MKNIESLRAALEKEVFPLPYTIKLIGRNTDAFNLGIRGLENAHPKLKLQSQRESDGGKHLAYSFHAVMKSPDEIIEIYRYATAIPDLLVLL
jgi:putative lipoic acid-binding regulatory protein